MDDVLKELVQKVYPYGENKNTIVYENDYGDIIEIQVKVREQICHLPECKWVTRKTKSERKVFTL